MIKIEGTGGYDTTSSVNNNDGRNNRRQRHCGFNGHDSNYVHGSGSRKSCHNCRIFVHLEANYWDPSGGAHEVDDEDEDDAENFPGVDTRALRKMPRDDDPRRCTLSDVTEVKWCILCSYWVTHFHMGNVKDNTIVHAETSGVCDEVDANVHINLPAGEMNPTVKSRDHETHTGKVSRRVGEIGTVCTFASNTSFGKAADTLDISV